MSHPQGAECPSFYCAGVVQSPWMGFIPSAVNALRKGGEKNGTVQKRKRVVV